MIPEDLRHFRSSPPEDSFLLLTAGDALKFLVLWGIVAIILDTAGLL